MADGSPLPGVAFDWKNPDYDAVFAQRVKRLTWLLENRQVIPQLKAYYAKAPWDFINDWGCTVDPRNVERGLPALVPFLLFPKQREWIEWTIERWRAQEPGITEKSRDCGVSWCAVGLGASMCLHHPGFSVGYGSRKEEYVDNSQAPKSLFWKARVFIENLPKPLRGGWVRKKHSAHMRLVFPETEATMTGEAGDNIGRGDRQSMYFVDESAHLERPLLVDASLSATTNCRQDVSSVNGLGNSFEQKRHGGKIKVFIFDWRDDPRKDDVWYQKQVDELDPVVLAQEVNRDYAASVEGVLIPSEWVRSAINAHLKLGIKPTGARTGSLDVADEGKDRNAFCGAHGIVVEQIEEWSGVGSDPYATLERAFGYCDAGGYGELTYDADGIGASVRGDARKINEPRTTKIRVVAFWGSGGVVNPEGQDEKGRLNQDYFMNLKAQSWWALRRRFRLTHRLIKELETFGRTVSDYDPDELISISTDCGNYLKLVSELSQPTFTVNTVGKIVVDKAPEGTKSPNMADAVMMKLGRMPRAPMSVDDDALGMI